MIYLVTNNLELYDRPVNSGIKLCTVEDSIKAISKMDIIGADTETQGFDPYTKKVISLQLGNAKDQYVIDTLSVDIQKYRHILTDKNKLFIWQNAGFDLRFLFYHGFYTPNLYDTYLAESVLNRGILNSRKGLDFLVYKYCKQVMDKTVRGSIHREGLSDRVIRYAAKDVQYLEEIMIKQMEHIKENDLEDYLRLENKFVIPLSYTMHCGMSFNSQQWKTKCNEDIKELDKDIKELDQYVLDHYPDSEFVDNQLDLFEDGVNCNILWSSDTQVKKFFKFLGLDTTVTVKGKTKESIDQKHLIKLVDQHPIVSKYLEYSKQAKLVSTYGLEFLKCINPETKRVHTVYKQILDTGRISSGNMDKKKQMWYPNLQNIPSDERHRSCFQTSGDNIMVVGDYSGQEQIILANQSQEPNLIEFYNKNLGDMHSYVCSKLFKELADVPLKEIKEKHKDKRQLAKSVGFAINYGGTGYTIAQNANISVEQGNKIYEDYFKVFNGLKRFFQQKQKQTMNCGYILINEISRSKTFVHDFEEFQRDKAKIDNYDWDNYRKHKADNSDYYQNVLYPEVRNYFVTKGMIERDSLNYPIQGTAAEMTKLAAINFFFDYIVANDLLFKVKIINMVHDEIVLECAKEIAEKTKNQLKNHMESAGNVFCKTIPIKADPEITEVWQH